MSSRRDSRIHISERQNDALLEFENFKRKYLLVNKHITKLNSTLSVRVEELNAQVSSLYVENLRLRASEISLASQLKKEKEKTRQVVDEAENAVGTLMRHLVAVRTSLDTRPTKLGSSSSIVKRKYPSSPVQPPRETTRLIKPPAAAITQIRESDEEDADEEEDDTPTRLITTRRPSTSRLPLPKLVSSPPIAPTLPMPSAIPHINLTAGATKRKVRRDSAFLTMERITGTEMSSGQIVRPKGSRRARRSSTEYDGDSGETESRVDNGRDITPTGEPRPKHGVYEGFERTESNESVKLEERARKVNGKGKGREFPIDRERETETFSNSERESSEGVWEKDKRRFGIKDVTNSPRKAISEFAEEKPPEGVTSCTLTTPLHVQKHVFDTLTPRPSASPLPSAVSTPATEGGSESGEGTGGRERRTRKSVNYTEPKLNTKMRKPDPPPETATKPRASGGTAARRRKSIPTPGPGFPSDDDGDADVEGSGSSTKWTEGRRRTVHNTSVTGSLPPSRPADLIAPTAGYGVWGPEGRRHSLAV